ncbi:uncharacterized protein TNCV_1536791 [Trichonephila clavipes]|nr:uncharacterized protein TNCV_1536791 [Trichonephila clavipes]
MNKNTKKKKRFKQPKVHLIFDEKEREDYLTGFQKRKLERKFKRNEALDVMLKNEKKRIKKSQKEVLENAIKSQRGVPPEFQHLIEPVTYDLPDHTVTVSQISNMDSIYASTTIDLDKTLPSNSVDEVLLKETGEEVDKLREQIRNLKANRLKTLRNMAWRRLVGRWNQGDVANVLRQGGKVSRFFGMTESLEAALWLDAWSSDH